MNRFKTCVNVVRYLDATAFSFPTVLPPSFSLSSPFRHLHPMFFWAYLFSFCNMVSVSLLVLVIYDLPYAVHGRIKVVLSCFLSMSLIIVSYSPICCRISSFLTLSAREILADLLSASISIASNILLLLSAILHVSDPYSKLFLITIVSIDDCVVYIRFLPLCYSIGFHLDTPSSSSLVLFLPLFLFHLYLFCRISFLNICILHRLLSHLSRLTISYAVRFPVLKYLDFCTFIVSPHSSYVSFNLRIIYSRSSLSPAMIA